MRKSCERCWQATFWSRVHAPTCQATGSFSFAFTLPGQPFLSDSQAKMSSFSSFTSYKIWHTWFCLVQEQVGVSSMWKKLQAEGNDVCNVLPALHTLSQVATQTHVFVGKGETTHLLISLVSLMFSVPWKIFWHATSHVEHFVCMLYNSTTTTWTFCVMQSL